MMNDKEKAEAYEGLIDEISTANQEISSLRATIALFRDNEKVLQAKLHASAEILTVIRFAMKGVVSE